MNPTYDFKNQVALVTGGASGMGLATAKGFARAGAAVAIVDRNAAKVDAAVTALQADGARVLGIVCDVSDESQAKAAVERTVAEFGRLDMAYNNAGILGPICPMSEETVEGYDAVQAVNLRGVWTFMKHELLQMKKQGSGAIVNCSSLGGLVGLAGRAAYHASKHGVTLDGEKLFFEHVHLHGGPAPVRRYLPHLIDLVCSGRIDPGRVFDLSLPLEQAAEGYRAMDERRAIKALLRP